MDLGQLKERQYLRSCQKWNAFQNPDPDDKKLVECGVYLLQGL